MIVVTGSESFVGRELIKQLLEQKKEVIGIDLVNEKSQNYEYIKMDIWSNSITDIIPNNAEAIILKINKNIHWVILGGGRKEDWVKSEIKKNGLENCFML